MGLPFKKFSYRLEDVYAEFGLYEAHVEGMQPSASMLIGWCGD